jgi:hypothetical protein
MCWEWAERPAESLASDYREVAAAHPQIKGQYREVEVAGIAALTTDVAQLRLQWANAVNAAYREAGLDLWADHRSHRDRGLEIGGAISTGSLRRRLPTRRAPRLPPPCQ